MPLYGGCAAANPGASVDMRCDQSSGLVLAILASHMVNTAVQRCCGWFCVLSLWPCGLSIVVSNVCLTFHRTPYFRF